MKYIIFCITLGFYWLISLGATPHNEHVRLALSLLHGHLNIDPYPVWEQVIVKGHAYILHPPLSAIACLPFVAIGIYNQTLICIFYGAISIGLTYELTQKLISFSSSTSDAFDDVTDDNTNNKHQDRQQIDEHHPVRENQPSVRYQRPLLFRNAFRTAAIVPGGWINLGRFISHPFSKQTYDETTSQSQSEYSNEKGTQGEWRNSYKLKYPNYNMHALWLTAFLLLGTVFSYQASLGASWGFALVLSTVPSLLCLIELQGKARPWLVGLLAALAALARYELVLLWPVYLIWLMLIRGRNFRRWGQFLLVPLVVALLYCVWNLVRFNTLTDITLWLWYHQDLAGAGRHPELGPFSLRYLPLGIFTALFLGAGYNETFPYIHSSAFGLSLFCTSPALILALRPTVFNKVNLLLFAAVILSMGPALCVYSNGVEQLGARYWIQAFPFLLALMARSKLDQLARILIIASIVFTSFFAYQVRYYGFMS